MRKQRSKSKFIDIRLKEEKFYFLYETIKGTVILHLKSPTKTNAIRIRFAGEIVLAMKSKETILLFEEIKQLHVGGETQGKPCILEAKQHIFAFEFKVPTRLSLPSSMELEKGKARIRYLLTAVHDRPMVPESLSAKAEYCVRMLEFIDVTGSLYDQPQEKVAEAVMSYARNEKCLVRISTPRSGFTQGEIVPLNIVIHHCEALESTQGLVVNLMRIIEVRTYRNTVTSQVVLKSIEQDICITEANAFSQSITCSLLIPTSTPPTIHYKKTTLVVHYKISVNLQLRKKNTTQREACTVELPIIIGTWPRAAVPIDDDEEREEEIEEDDEEIEETDSTHTGERELVNAMGDMALKEETIEPYAFDMTRSRSTDRVSKRSSISEYNGLDPTFPVVNASGISTYPPYLCSDTADTLSMNTSSTNRTHATKYSGEIYTPGSRNSFINPSFPMKNDIYLQPNQPCARNSSCGATPDPSASQTYLSRSSSTPDLLALSANTHLPLVGNPSYMRENPPSQRAQATSYYDPGPQSHRNSMIGMHSRQSKSLNTPPSHQHYSSLANRRSGHHARVASDELHYATHTVQPTQFSHSTHSSGPYPVPNHVLQPMLSSLQPPIQQSPTPTATTSTSLYSNTASRLSYVSISHLTNNTHLMSISDDSEDSDDNDDLLGIIAKKKKQQEKQAKERQDMVFVVNDSP
ncbi:hypothetical protein BDF14DRAFT_1771606 [Spinellus fusiger]|nr:hypothetical protein BDF14DRAFT_1771606 [Spinellus fusiger]